MTRWVYFDASVGMELCYDPMRQFHVMNFAVTDLLGPQRSSRAGQWLQSRRDAKRIAQDERGTSAVLGEDAQNELLLPFFVMGVPASGLARPSRKREEEMWGSRYPVRRPLRPCPGLFSSRPSRGSGDRRGFARFCSVSPMGELRRPSELSPIRVELLDTSRPAFDVRTNPAVPWH